MIPQGRRSRDCGIGKTSSSSRRLAVIHEMKPAEIHTQSFLKGRVRLVVGDITHQRVDAIVNAANSTLTGWWRGRRRNPSSGGPSILEECRRFEAGCIPKGLPAGEAVITSCRKSAVTIRDSHCRANLWPAQWSRSRTSGRLL